jgi:lysophospholipase L1-like esterase
MPMNIVSFLSGIPRCGQSLLFLAAGFGLAATGWSQPEPGKWEKEIAAFEAMDKTNPPPPNAILFVGSSIIRLWKTLARDFPEFPVINRGFGGSEMADSLRFAARIVLPYRPRQVVVYAGDNDLANGKTPEQVSEDYREFVRKVRDHLPRTRLAYIAIKPSPSRWKLAEKARTANRLIAQFSATDDHLAFIDIFTPMLNGEKQPREELFLSDKLHLNAEGYQLWTDTIRPHLR